MNKRRAGQVWVETVIYTLIGLALIGIVLAIATPKINEQRDRIVVEQSIEALNGFDSKIEEVLDRGPSNIRIIPVFSIKRGVLIFDGGEDSIYFKLDDLKKPYSEYGAVIKFGRVEVKSEKVGKLNSVTLALNYSARADLKYGSSDDLKEFGRASIPYKFSIENKGKDVSENKIVVSILEENQ